MHDNKNPEHSTEPTPPGNTSNTIVGSGKTRAWGTIRGRLWPSLASPRYKLLVVGAATFVLLGAGAAALWWSGALEGTDTNPQAEKGGQSGVNDDKTAAQTGDNKPADTDKPSKDKPSQAGQNGNKKKSGGGSGSGSCAWPNFPDASCTGVPAGTTLHNCSTNLNVAGATYDGCLFDGQVEILANNITIKNSKVLGRVNVGYGTYSGLVLTDVEIDGQNEDPHGQSAIGQDNYTCIRCNVHNTGRGASVGNNVIIKDSYFHDFYDVPGAHQTAIGSNGGAHNQIIHNNLQCNNLTGQGACSAALSFYGDFDPIDDILVQYNLLNTTGSYCTYAGSTGTSSGKPYPHGTNIRYLDNRFGKKYFSTCGIYGPVTSWESNSGNVWSGNAWADGSGTVNP